MDNLEELGKKKEFEKFQQAIGAEKDPIMLILRAHLFSENLLERLINFRLPRGDKVIENGNLNYHQKLVLAEALECLSDPIVSSLRNLNKLRNQCAHELHKKITEGDITRIGSPLGKNFTRFKRDAKFDEAALLRKVVDYICGYISATCFGVEHPELNEPKATEAEKRITSRPTRTAHKRTSG
ncbi:hypothetical protein [Massilia sp. TS11]|uniref:hypothetical protein n=1 Tax=Massilia sp. TS11 TaxID=2908003 RepID=UPI001ED9E645|nr:hypothetical protein [Massilia sp. TS11]MCG2584142.1 hypothetical protein [Massilia sp. TS11]